MKRIDAVALGELLIDFTESGLSAQGNRLMEANPGGAPCNVLAMLTRLGKKTAFIGKVGDDLWGRQLRDVLNEVGIETRGLRMDRTVPTTLAFVHTAPDGDRDFSFYRSPGADMALTADEVDAELISEARLFHYGSLSMTHPDVREATHKAVRLARAGGCLISFDPNLREPLWRSLDEAHEQIAWGLGHCDVLKISDNEIRWFTGLQDFDDAVQKLQQEYRIPLLLLSMGRDGSRASHRGKRVEAAPFLQDGTVETTGAGDTFCACALNCILDHGLDALTEDDLREMLSFANAAASLITTRKGALRVMPALEEIEALRCRA